MAHSITDRRQSGVVFSIFESSATPGNVAHVTASSSEWHHLFTIQVSDSFPFKWINKKWKEGFHVTSMATSHLRWAVVMSRNAGFIDQCVELDFQYPSEGIHRRWDGGFRITSCASTPDQVCPFNDSLWCNADSSWS